MTRNSKTTIKIRKKGVPAVAQWDQQCLCPTGMQRGPSAQHSGLRSHGVGCNWEIPMPWGSQKGEKIKIKAENEGEAAGKKPERQSSRIMLRIW